MGNKSVKAESKDLGVAVTVQPRRRPGHVTRCTPELAEAIAAHIERACPAKHAARREGVAYQTFLEWCRRGRAGEEPYQTFGSIIEHARAELSGTLSGIVYADAFEDAASAKWLLERSFGEHWSPPKERKELDHKGLESGPAVSVTITRDEAIAAARAVSRALPRIAATGGDDDGE